MITAAATTVATAAIRATARVIGETAFAAVVISTASTNATATRPTSVQLVCKVSGDTSAHGGMAGLSYVVQYGPSLFTDLIAWIGAALAFVAALAAWRKGRNGRSALVAVRMRSLPDGGCAVTVRNVGDRFALDVQLEAGGATGFIGGLGAGKEVLLELDAVPQSPSTMTLHWNDADGRARDVQVSFSLTGSRWKRDLPAVR